MFTELNSRTFEQARLHFERNRYGNKVYLPPQEAENKVLQQAANLLGMKIEVKYNP